MGVNYGLNKVRFPAPLKEGQKYRLNVKLGDVKEIENGVEWHEVFLEDAWRTLAKEVGDADEFARRWVETAQTWRFGRINTLIDQHNRNFPIEARLPMDPKTRDFVRINGRPYQRVPLGAAWVLVQFPADLDAARAA